jgi:hypothetical protein
MGNIDFEVSGVRFQVSAIRSQMVEDRRFGSGNTLNSEGGMRKAEKKKVRRAGSGKLLN